MREPGDGPASTRYDGLDLFRPFSVFGVVLIHFSQALVLPSTPAFLHLVRVRDCALPIMVLTSFFVLTRALMADPRRSFARFAANRFRRLVVPCVVWTGLYWVMFEVIGPLWSGGQASWPPPTRWLSGYIHLWFLQFLFVCGVILFPVIRLVARYPWLRWMFAAGCVAAAAGYWAWSNPLVSSGAVLSLVQDPDASLRVAIRQSVVHAKYPLLGVAMALMADLLAGLYRRPAFRAAAMLVAVGALAAHVSASAPAVSRVVYSLAVFVALLRPWPPGALGWLRPVAKYSYPIYILHPALAQAVVGAFACWQVGPSLASWLAGSVVVFALSWAAAGMLRTPVPGDWFLPLVRVPERGAGTGMR